MRPLFTRTPTRTQRALETLGLGLAAVLIALGQSGADELLASWAASSNASGPTYAGYGYREDAPTNDAVARAVSASAVSDDHVCRQLHGDNASAQQRPDGSHRCVDKYGRRLSSRSGVTIPAHALAQVAP